MSNMYHTPAISSSYSPPPEPSDDISLLLRQILFKSSSSSSSSSSSPFRNAKLMKSETQPQQPPPTGAANNIPVNAIGHVASSSVGTVNYDPDEYDSESERRRSRINEKIKALQKLIPNSNKTDKASMLDEAIEYLKQLQLQVQMLTMRNGISLYSMCAPHGVLQPDLRPSGLNHGNQPINMTASHGTLVNPMLSQNQPSILDFSRTMNQEPSFGTQLGSA
ncbi:hypothetical protein L1987_44193 [Smallanthus sonchifolius]|uniref:Uncharacterized protein n=1 Tax=Smallanthus sonchifolius TaxID=185202 RepID=A0ACB9GPY6_9ASTR|nr:hypothetical protein L1987_44193 [Smallanthus sonchifolius]